jgi:hypothetical protein
LRFLPRAPLLQLLPHNCAATLVRSKTIENGVLLLLLLNLLP